jgi:acetoacetyl-CoA synthetase
MSADVLWQPTPQSTESSRIGRYLKWLKQTRGLDFSGYRQLWRWSVTDLAGFWGSIFDHFGIVAAGDPTTVPTAGSRSSTARRPDDVVVALSSDLVG